LAWGVNVARAPAGKHEYMTQDSFAARRRALIVEDEFLIALDLETDLSALGFDICDLAANASQARSLAMSNEPDVVLMDVNLEGGREGIEAARWLREVCNTAVVFVTSYNDDDTVERIHQQVPGAPVLAKPVYRETLADAVAAATKH
jgi:two-component system, response regulator PdtaR